MEFNAEFIKQLEWERECLIWLKDNHIKNEKGLELEFTNHRFLKDIFRDWTPIQVVRKASQVGFSSMEILKSLWAARYKKYNIIYTLPTFGDVGQFVPSKVNAFISQNSILQQWTKDKDTVLQKKVGDGFIYYRGTFASGKDKMESAVGIMFSSDLNIHDECFAELVDVLTDSGWKGINEIEIADRIATLKEDGVIEWNHPDRIIRQNYCGDVIRFKGRSLNFLTTIYHKIWQKPYYGNGKYSFKKAEELLKSPAFQIGINGKWEHRKKRYYIIPSIIVKKKIQGSFLLPIKNVKYGISKYPYISFCKFLGWYLSEGNVSKVRGKITGAINIVQKKDNFEDIRNTLIDCGFKYKENINKKRVHCFIVSNLKLAYYLNQFGNSFEKYIPKDILENSYGLKELLEKIQLGDGDSRGVITTVSKRLADDIQEAYLKIGIKTTIRKLRQNGKNDLYRVMKHKYNFTVFNRYLKRQKSGRLTIEKYNGDVYCLAIKNHIFMARDKHNYCPFWTGNSDRSDQLILEQYESRLEASEYRGRWYFSNPTSPNTLSQKLYEKSDQKHWFVKCGHCNEWQYLDYWKNVKDGQFICHKCKGIITDEMRRNGQWVKKYAGREISGYHIPHLICPWISAAKIQEEEQTKSKQYFYNFVLGLPYIGSDVVVNQDIILKCIDNTKPNFQQHNVMGVDTGIEKYYVILNNEGIFKIGKTKSWEEIEELIKTYDIEVCVIDAMPDITAPRKIKEKYPGKIWLCYFRKEIRKADYIIWDYKTHTVFSDRTKIIQHTIDKFVNREVRIQMHPESLIDYIKHWQSLYKTTELDPIGIEKDVWQSAGDDHFCFATIYGILAMEKGEKGGTEIRDWSEEKKPYDGLAPSISEEIERQENGY